MYSRGGKLFYPPSFFKDTLPKDLALDGELWTKRDDFQKTVSIVRRQDQNQEWKQITYMVYDAPLLDKKFKNRLKVIKQTFQKHPSKYVMIHKQIKCFNQKHLTEETNRVIKEKGEGMMIKNPSSEYVRKRSNQLLKCKQFDDDEATIIGHENGTGRLDGLMGAIRVRSDSGKEFKIGSGFDDSQREKPPQKGQRVTYRHQGVSKTGIPRFPTFIRVHPGKGL